MTGRRDHREDAEPAPAPGQAGGGGPDAAPRSVGRRGLLSAAGAGILAGGMLGGFGGFAGGRASAEEPAPSDPLDRSYPLRGEHQQGITTPAQDYLFTAAFDVTTTDLDEVRRLMQQWLVAAEQMSTGDLVGGTPLADLQAVPRDTGEAWGYPASSVTITVGAGRSFFVDAEGRDRFGIAERMPEALADGVPRFAGEALQAERSDGDLVIQACADDAQVAMHAIRNLTRIAVGTAALRWTQMGYGRTSSTSTTQETPRNLFGYKDGTNNLKQEDGAEELGRHVWIDRADSGGERLAGGSYMMIRKIRMNLETWDRLRLIEQHEIIGRDKRFGAPLTVPDPTSGEDEFIDPDLAATEDGSPVIPRDAHIRVVSPHTNKGASMLRRGFNYTEGSDSLGRIDAGLFFIAYVRDPRESFFPILERMVSTDALEEYLRHVASAMFVVLPGVGAKDTMFGQALLS
ncbi:deferrochelatase/peroxidase EfeB [Brachybacterium vulturis]|uniref:Deferrochelatase/peroxidase EfeB n=1 Tax=Brachybacterium vulturis TaxID=2017484 RepID=A0A291GM30_9MICO|nr:Dyp-type peroxidase [Brachybacterium vulturis]ATG51399.1 deferrochelatase/peroxidase EfeB [Brachybacterium vulturis]